MYISTNKETAEAMKAVLAAQADKPQNIRVFIAGMGWSGPSFGLGLDEVNADDYSEEHFGVNFVIEKVLYEQFGEVLVEFAGNGYKVQPVVAGEAGCGSCGGGCA